MVQRSSPHLDRNQRFAHLQHADYLPQFNMP
jgi:hypothetical protein